jgi:hypothetical protein
MLIKIISGGQTGVDRAALDAAIEMGAAHGGWVPLGRRSEAGAIPDRYHVNETGSEDYAQRTEKNIADSDGTLIISRRALRGGTKLTHLLATELGKPMLHIDLSRISAFQAARDISEWVAAHEIGVLNVAGPRASEDDGVYEAAKSLIKAFLHLYQMRDHAPDVLKPDRLYPHTAAEAVERLDRLMPLKDKVRLARMGRDELPSLSDSLGEYIENRFGLRFGNRRLFHSCAEVAGQTRIDAQGASSVVIRILWEHLRETHLIRRVK